ncbi:MAG: aminoacyl-tRNA hydrolase, partial [Leuconostoc fallax]
MKYIFGLGNIGKKYENTRHNIGFMAIDALAEKYNATFSPSKQFAYTAKINIDGVAVMLVKPTTYMNESGQAVRAILDYYNGNIEDVLVLVDDMDMPFGKLRFRDK